MAAECVRLYRLRPGALRTVTQAAEATLVPTLRQQPGFLAYRLTATADDRAVSVSVWESESQAAFANLLEAEWIRDAIASVLVGLPDELIGRVVVDRRA